MKITHDFCATQVFELTPASNCSVNVMGICQLREHVCGNMMLALLESATAIFNCCLVVAKCAGSTK